MYASIIMAKARMKPTMNITRMFGIIDSLDAENL
jgi:hypothetical protein